MESPSSNSPRLRRLLSAKELAHVLGVHPNYIYDQAVNGDLPSYKIGGVRRFRLRDVEEWLEARKHVATKLVMLLVVVGVVMYLASQVVGSHTRVRAKSPRQSDVPAYVRAPIV